MSENTYNPLHVGVCSGLSSLENSIIVEKILSNEIREWNCPICFETLNNKDLFICFPYNCYHLTCFSCFKTHCKVLHNMNKDPTKVLRCSICRSSPSKEWKDSPGIIKRFFDYNDFKIKLYDV